MAWKDNDTQEQFYKTAAEQFLRDLPKNTPIILPVEEPKEEQIIPDAPVLTDHQQWVFDRVKEAIELGYRPIPHFVNAPAKYGNQEHYPVDHPSWLTAKWVSLALDDCLLLDYDGNKHDDIMHQEELADVLGLEYESLLDDITQENDAGDSVHWLFRRGVAFEAGMKNSADGALAVGIDIKTHNQLMHLKPGKRLTLVPKAMLPNAPALLIDTLRGQRGVDDSGLIPVIEPKAPVSVDPVEPGQRNSKLAQLVGKWIAENKTAGQIFDAASAWNRTLVQPLDGSEVNHTISSICATHLKNTGEDISLRTPVDPAAFELPDPPEAPVEADDIGFGVHLLNLPGALGQLQDAIYNAALYPSRDMAAFVALSTFTAIAQPKFTINYAGGLGLNQSYIVMGKTAYGKSRAVSRCQDILKQAVELAKQSLPASVIQLPFEPNFMHQMPASCQKLHLTLQDYLNPNVFIYSDEFAEWLAGTKSDGARQGLVGYWMESYDKSVGGSLTPPNSMSGNYESINDPKIGLLATTTGERLMETLTASQGDAGTLNRIVFCPSNKVVPQKQYFNHDFSVDPQLLRALANILTLGQQSMQLTRGALDVWILNDQQLFEREKELRPQLGGRLGDQALKLAALVAISDASYTHITETHMAVACEIRKTLHNRMLAMVEEEGGFGESAMDIAIDQLTGALERNQRLAYSHLKNYSRQFKKLDARDKDFVIKQLVSMNIATKVVGKHGGFALVKVGGEDCANA